MRRCGGGLALEVTTLEFSDALNVEEIGSTSAGRASGPSCGTTGSSNLSVVDSRNGMGSWYDLTCWGESPPESIEPERVTTMPAVAVSRPWQRFLRLSVRGLVVLVLVMGAALGWIVRGARVQREAVAVIKKAAGTVSYDYEWKNGGAIPGGRPWAPRWWIDCIGVDYFGHPALVLVGESDPDTVVPAIGRLTRVEALTLRAWRLTDGGLAHLNELKNLTRLDLDFTLVSDAGLAYLKRMKKLSTLHLASTKVTNAGLAHLKEFKNLTELALCGTEVTDVGLAHLKALKNLTDLNLADTRVSDAGLAHLTGLNKLSTLNLVRTKVTDAGMMHLEELKNLTDLDLRFTHVTDSGLAHLKGLTKLSILDLRGTQVSAAGIGELERVLPGLKITGY
jgi:uncharacterized membrane protein